MICAMEATTTGMPTEPEEGPDQELSEQVTPLELFFDLVFVFAFTQVTGLMAAHPTWEGLGLCEEGKAGELIHDGAVTYGGKWVVNPSGGLISKGHPLGATGLAQCAELNWQLRGLAEKRQVPGAKVALQHNLGLGGAAVVTMYRKAA